MRDTHDDKTPELPISPISEAKPRKTKLPKGAMTAAERKREQRIRQAEAVYQRDSHTWTDAECLAILGKKQWHGGAIDKMAWEQLGKLRKLA